MNKYPRLALFGFLSWLVPFVVSVPFYSSEGKLLIDIFLFKSLMIGVGSATGAALLVLYLRNMQKEWLREGIFAGSAMFAANIILDLLVLLPLSGMDMGTYFVQIGSRYLVIPIMGIAMGYLMEIQRDHI
jgi:hypothetical protein